MVMFMATEIDHLKSDQAIKWKSLLSIHLTLMPKISKCTCIFFMMKQTKKMLMFKLENGNKTKNNYPI